MAQCIENNIIPILCIDEDDISAQATAIPEKYLDKNGNVIVEIDPQYFRPTEVDVLLGNPSKAKKILGWEAKTTMKELAEKMVTHDLALIKGK